MKQANGRTIHIVEILEIFTDNIIYKIFTIMHSFCTHHSKFTCPDVWRESLFWNSCYTV